MPKGLSDVKAMLLLTSMDQRIRRQEDALRAAVKIIRQWHGMGMPTESEKIGWGIYYSKSPEMAPIRELLGKDPTQ